MSTRTFRILDDAIADAEAATAWYRAEAGDEVASQFAQEIDTALVQIAEWPFSGRLYDRDTRCYVLRTFPFLIFYRVTADSVEVRAVGHGRRRPAFWRDR